MDKNRQQPNLKSGSALAPFFSVVLISFVIGTGLLGREIDLKAKNSASFLHDVSLRTVSVTDEGARFVVNRWREQ